MTVAFRNDQNTAGADLVGVRLNLLDLATSSDTTGGSLGSAFDNVTNAHDLTLSALLEPSQQALLFDGLTQVGGLVTADASGHVQWALTGVAAGLHDYAVYNPVELVPYRFDNNLASSHLDVKVL